MKRIISIGLLVILPLLTSCESGTETAKLKESEENPSTVIEEQQTLEDTSLAEQLASEFTLETKPVGFGKKLEDIWKENKDDIEISAMYFYHGAKFYEGIEDLEMAKDSMKNISPYYNGVMSSEIVEYGVTLFDSIEEWNGDNTQKDEKKEKLTDNKRIEVKDWINNRYDYYDEKEGKYCGDKYSETIFNEAATEFGFTYQEIYNIWSDLPL